MVNSCLQVLLGAIHKRHTHAMGGGGLAKSVRFIDKGEGEGFRIVYLRTHFSRRLFTEVTTYDKKVVQIYVWKIEEKILNTQKLNL